MLVPTFFKTKEGDKMRFLDKIYLMKKDPKAKNLHSKTKEIEKLKKEIKKAKDINNRADLLQKCLDMTEEISKEYLEIVVEMNKELYERVRNTENTIKQLEEQAQNLNQEHVKISKSLLIERR